MSYFRRLRSWSARALSSATTKLTPRENSYERLDVIQRKLEDRLSQIQESLGRIENRQLEKNNSTALIDYEYQVFSQWGEDGIIQHLIRQVEIDREIFVEFGAADYRESNTRFLLVNNNWSGLVFDSSQEAIEDLRRRSISWRYNLKAAQAFITRDNINALIKANGISGDIGLLSIDIDGNDYWVWQAIDVVNPAIVVIEYNHRFGSELAVTIPYKEGFRRGGEYPIIYFGASLAALCMLGTQKGYSFVGCNSNGVNAFFVRSDKLPEALRALTASEGYVAGKFTEVCDERGFYVPAAPEEERAELLKLPLVDLRKAV